VNQIGRSLVVLGLALVVLGAVLMVAGRLPFRIGRLPGDIVIRGKNTTFYFPLVTCLIVSVVLSLLGWLLNRR
jgi:hypothetical protein